MLSNAFAHLASCSKQNPVEPGIFENYESLDSTDLFWWVYRSILV